MFSCFCHIALYTCSTIVYCLKTSTRAKGNDLLYLYTSNDDDVIKNYITDMDLALGEDSDSHSCMRAYKRVVRPARARTNTFNVDDLFRWEIVVH